MLADRWLGACQGRGRLVVGLCLGLLTHWAIAVMSGEGFAAVHARQTRVGGCRSLVRTRFLVVCPCRASRSLTTSLLPSGLDDDTTVHVTRDYNCPTVPGRRAALSPRVLGNRSRANR